ncbi:MAG: molybdopterin-guanine dinucleotide biosynthesis protein B [Candidatus Bathyarchaeia archaeon]
MIVLAVIGSKNSGKTATMEAIIRGLIRRGYKVAAVKHIPEKDFTVDEKGKDTWRFAASGAKTIVGIAPKEIFIIEKGDVYASSLEKILEVCRGNDIVLVEGFRDILGKNEKIPKIVAVKSTEEALEALKNFKPIIAFTGPHSLESLGLKVPYVDVLRDEDRIAEIVSETVKRLKGYGGAS